MKQRKVLITIAVILVIGGALALIVAPAILLYQNGQLSNLPTNLKDWANLGAYFGGTVAPIIGLLNVGVLAYISYLVHRNSSAQNRRLFNTRNKFDAFEELAMRIPQLHQLIFSFDHHYYKLNVENPDDVGQLLKWLNKYKEIDYFIYHFGNRFSHIFDYDFGKEEYQELQASTETLLDQLNEIEKQVLEGKLYKPENFHKNRNDQLKCLGRLVKGLKREVNRMD